jgi:hypothetical protein
MILRHLAVSSRRFLRTSVFLISLVEVLRGSGSYMIRPVRPPNRLVEDSQKYELGKAVFLGKAVLQDQAGTDKVAQRTRLAALQDKLPPRVRKTVDLSNLSGRLSADQFSALQHFLKVRHKID